MKNTFFIILLLFTSSLVDSMAEHESASPAYIFTKMGNCTKFDHAVIRLGAQLAWSLSKNDFKDGSVQQLVGDFILDQCEDLVPHVGLIGYDLESMDAELDVHLSAMKIFARDNIFQCGQINSRALKEKGKVNHRELKTQHCCACRRCNCCAAAACENVPCDRRKLRRNLKTPTLEENLLHQLAIPIFEMLDLDCVDTEDLIVILE